MNYYISDIHFGCQNSFDGRTLEHDTIVKENWNRVVTNGDTVYILGDIGKIGNAQDTEHIIKTIATLKGKKVLVTGNHDVLKDIRLKQLFVEICDYKEVIDNDKGITHKLVLSHYPMLFWNGQHKGWIHLYGHVHMSEEWKVYEQSLNYVNEYFENRTKKGYTDCPPAVAYNVGAVLLDWTPRTLKEIIEKYEKSS